MVWAEIREMIEPNLIYEPQNAEIANVTRDWKNPNDIQSLFRATEGTVSKYNLSMYNLSMFNLSIQITM